MYAIRIIKNRHHLPELCPPSDSIELSHAIISADEERKKWVGGLGDILFEIQSKNLFSNENMLGLLHHIWKKAKTTSTFIIVICMQNIDKKVVESFGDYSHMYAKY